MCVGLPGAQYTGTIIAGATCTQTAVYATATVPPPSNIAKGTTQACGRYYTVLSGDNRSLIALNNTITTGFLRASIPLSTPTARISSQDSHNAYFLLLTGTRIAPLGATLLQRMSLPQLQH